MVAPLAPVWRTARLVSASKPKGVVKRGRKQSRGRALSAAAMPAACRAASAAHMRRGVERQPRLSSHPCHARRRAPCAPVGALAVLHQPARRGAMHPGHCVGRQPACLSTEQERMLRTLAQHQLASNQALSPLHSRPRAPAAALLNAQAQEPPLVVAALCSAACEQRSARQTRGTPGRLWDGGPPSECEPHRRPCLPQPRASGAKRQRRACFSVTVSFSCPFSPSKYVTPGRQSAEERTAASPPHGIEEAPSR